jgi:homoserine O-acetyltransferase/O-succinyltransferase
MPMTFRTFAAALLLLATAPAAFGLMAINSGDDEANPPQLASTAREIQRIPNAKYVLIPASENTHGHFTHLRASFWKAYVAEFLKDLPAQPMCAQKASP